MLTQYTASSSRKRTVELTGSSFESFPRITLHITIFFSLLSRRRSGWPARRRRPKRSLDRKNLESLTGSRHNIHFSYFSLISYLLSFVHIIDAFCPRWHFQTSRLRTVAGETRVVAKMWDWVKSQNLWTFLYFWKVHQKIVKKLDFLTSCEVAPERCDLPETKRIRRKRLSLNFECIFFVFTLS